MAEDKPEDIDSSPDAGRAKRAPPTIDLEATDVSAEAPNEAPSEAPSSEARAESKRSVHGRWRTPTSSAAIAAVSGACAAALVLALAWLLGWPGDIAPSKRPAAPAVNAAAIDDLTTRIASLESKTSKPALVPDPAADARIDALEKSVGALRVDFGKLREQLEKLVSQVNEAKTASGEPTAPPQLSEINERIAALETTMRAQSAAMPQESAKPVDEVPLRRIVAAALLDVLVRTGDPYPTALATAKSLAPNPDALKPLEAFAATGVPSAAVLSRDLLSLVPKLSPPSTENSRTGTSLIDRLQAGAAKLVRIERTDAVGNERGNVVARVTAAALRNDYNEARRELTTLTPADRAPAQGWIEKADARDAALAASRQFAAEAMTALAKPAP
ncbi:MAG: hypothetical protein E6G79_17020 [Alphaproteobacteria bacterium]|nr:MAG: hypothetical protein E6G79_17020 [Alphaproteobacteria bacterium]